MARARRGLASGAKFSCTLPGRGITIRRIELNRG
jgi:hypothetical protein